MTRTVTLTAFGLLATLAASSLSPVLADGRRDRLQTDKNNSRNIAIAGAAVAVYGLLSHNKTATVVGAAAGALGGSQYEKDRHQQSQDNNGRGYYRGDWNGNGGRDRDNSGWSQGQGRDWNAHGGDNGRSWNGGDNNRQWNNTDYHRQGDRDSRQWNQDGRSSYSNRDGDRDVDTCNDGGRHTHDR